MLELGEGRFLRCTHVNKQGNEEEEWISKKADEAENERAALADAGGDLRGTRITQSGGEECTQDPATIHWKCRQQIEKDEHNINHEELGKEIGPAHRRLRRQSTPTNDRKQSKCDDHVHQ